MRGTSENYKDDMIIDFSLMWTADSLLHIRISMPLGSANRAQELEQSGGSIGGVDGHQEANRKRSFHT